MTIRQLYWPIRGRQCADRDVTAAGGFVVLWIKEVHTEGFINPGSPGPRPCPPGRAAPQTDLEVKLEGKVEMRGGELFVSP